MKGWQGGRGEAILVRGGYGLEGDDLLEAEGMLGWGRYGEEDRVGELRIK